MAGALSIMLRDLRWRAISFHWVHMWQASCILLGSALSISSLVVISESSSMQDACHIWSQLNDLWYVSWVHRAPAMCSGGHRFDSCRGLGYFFVPRARVMLINSSFIKAAVCIVTRCKNVISLTVKMKGWTEHLVSRMWFYVEPIFAKL